MASFLGLIFSSLLASPPARAQVNGALRYNNSVVEYYSGLAWKSMDQGDTAVACTTAGSIRYNASQSRLEFCNGTTWRSMDSGQSTAGAGSAGQIRFSGGKVQFHNGTAWSHASFTGTKTIVLTSGSHVDRTRRLDKQQHHSCDRRRWRRRGRNE